MSIGQIVTVVVNNHKVDGYVSAIDHTDHDSCWIDTNEGIFLVEDQQIVI